jgi:uncharacterized membrane protein
MATSQSDAAIQAVVTDMVRVGRAAGVALSPGRHYPVDPSAVVTHTHILTNTGNSTDTFHLDVRSTLGWPATLIGDAYLTGTLRLPVVNVGPGETAAFSVRVIVPTRALSGTRNTVLVTATSRANNNVSAMVTDTLTVNRVGSVALAPDGEQDAEWEDIVTYTHTLTNTGSATDSFSVTLSSLEGWPVQLLTETYPTGTLHLSPLHLGAWHNSTFHVRVIVPPSDISGTLDVVTVTAASLSDGSVFAKVTDTTRIIRFLYVPIVMRNNSP